MKYFFVLDADNSVYIIVAKDLERAKAIAKESDIEVDTIYALEQDTFKDEGFLITLPA